MENIKSFEVQELDDIQLQEIEGGFITLIMAGLSLCAAAYGAGYLTGKALF
jgi:lactobin A/cerein 7B family class IIb bacteriocin